VYPYWLLFLFPAFMALKATPRKRSPGFSLRRARMDGAWLVVLFVLTVMMGLRYQVGGDWWNYIGHLRRAAQMDLGDVLSRSEPVYWLLTRISALTGLGPVGVNVVTGFLMSLGLVRFCLSLPRPWLAFSVAVPYLVIVVGMGYSRQGAALGCMLLGVLALGRQSFVWFVVWVVLGATFHKSAVLLLPVGALTGTRNRYLAGVIVLAASALAYRLLLQDEVDNLVENYIDAEYQSSGALIRLTMNLLPALIFLRYRRRFGFTRSEDRLWLLFSLAAVALFAGFFLTSASTALDRMALYCIPLQLLAFSYLPDFLGRPGRRNIFVVLAILGYYAAVLFVWLSFGNNARLWLPYQMGW
jgi:hypothetical protein